MATGCPGIIGTGAGGSGGIPTPPAGTVLPQIFLLRMR